MRTVRRWGVGATVVWCALACAPMGSPSTGSQPIVDTFTGPDGLIASPGQLPSGSPWVLTSGSLFRSTNQGWSGRPDDGRSEEGNGSAVFRMVSVERSFVDVDVGLRMRVDDLVSTARTPARDFDGAHVWVRYQSDDQLYAVSIYRRDGKMVIKKKCAGGPSNGGSYIDLTPPISDQPIGLEQWQMVTVTVRDRPDGSVQITASRDGWQLEAVDRGAGCPPLRGPGGVGLRGDNAELRIDDVSVATS